MPPAKHREPIIPAKMKIVIEELLSNPVHDLKAAGEKAGLDLYWVKRYLKQPHVLKYFREERAAKIEQVCSGNAAALAKVRAESDNGMAVTAAVRGLESLREVAMEETGNGVPRMQPGLVVQVVYTDGRPPEIIAPALPRPSLQIEGEAEREALEPPGR